MNRRTDRPDRTYRCAISALACRSWCCMIACSSLQLAVLASALDVERSPGGDVGKIALDEVEADGRVGSASSSGERSSVAGMAHSNVEYGNSVSRPAHRAESSVWTEPKREKVSRVGCFLALAHPEFKCRNGSAAATNSALAALDRRLLAQSAGTRSLASSLLLSASLPTRQLECMPDPPEMLASCTQDVHIRIRSAHLCNPASEAGNDRSQPSVTSDSSCRFGSLLPSSCASFAATERRQEGTARKYLYYPERLDCRADHRLSCDRLLHPQRRPRDRHGPLVRRRSLRPGALSHSIRFEPVVTRMS